MRDAIIFVGFLRPPPPMPPPLTPQYLTILMTERGGAIIFCRNLEPPNDPPPPPHTPQYLTILMTESERGWGRYYQDFNARKCPPPKFQNTLITILMTEMRDAIIFVGFWLPQCPFSPDATILNYLTDRKGGGHYLL